jgi:DNA-binding response OmpR family regulator
MSRQTTVLIVENDSMVGPMLRMVLERSGHHALLAQNGREAIDFARRCRNEIDLVVCDVVLWGESGQKIAAEICGLSPLARVLFISAVPLWMLSEQDLLSARVLASGAARFLQKPFLPGVMIGVVNNLLAYDRDVQPTEHTIQRKASTYAVAH